VQQAQKSWVAKAWALPRKVLTSLFAQGKKTYAALKRRYGPRYTHALLSAAFFTLFFPIPGIWVGSVAFIVAIAEVHHAISQRGGFAEASAELIAGLNAHMPFWAPGRWPAPFG
jgi:hypothetical protein